MKILITAGGTREYIDEVRVLTNISTGRTGSSIARHLHSEGHEITLIKSIGAEEFIYARNAKLKEPKILYFETVDGLMLAMQSEVPKHDVVIHSAAVSDFGFTPTLEKLKSNDPEAFIESLRKRIYRTPKILSHIKEWNPNCFLISFKFEVGKKFDDLLQIATESMENNKSDIVVANDKKEMEIHCSHVAYVIEKNGRYTRCDNLAQIYKTLQEKIESK